MNILTAYYGHQERGCWKRLSLLLKRWSDAGHQVTLLVSSQPNNLNGLSIKTIVIPFTGKSKCSLFLFLLLANVLALYHGIFIRYQAVVAFDCHNASAFFLVKKTLSIPVFLFMRGVYKYQDLFIENNLLTSLFSRKVNEFGYVLADHVVFNSEASKRDSVKIFKHVCVEKSCSTIRNNIIKTPLVGMEIRKKNRRDLGFAENDFIIGYLGQLVSRKNIPFLINAVAGCQSSRVRLLIQGAGPEENFLHQQVAEKHLEKKVTFKDWDKNILNFFSAIDLFVLPSFYDDSSNALIEAIAAEKIIFCSDKGGSSEILEEYKELLFCPYHDQQVLSYKIDRACQDENYRNMIINHIKVCKENLIFEWEKSIEDFMQRELRFYTRKNHGFYKNLWRKIK